MQTSNPPAQQSKVATTANTINTNRQLIPGVSKLLSKLTRYHWRKNLPLFRFLNGLVTVLLLLNLVPTLFAGLPTASAASPAASRSDQLPPTPAPTKGVATQDPHLPSLSLLVSVTPSLTLSVGQSATLVVSIDNSAPDAAQDLTVKLPLPQGAEALPDDANANFKGYSAPDKGWQWSVGTMAAHSSLTLKANFRVKEMPKGEAIVTRVEVNAKGLPIALHRVGGAVVVADPDGAKVQNAASFQPGQSTTLKSQDGKVEVKFGPRAYAGPLNLQHRTLESKKNELAQSAKTAGAASNPVLPNGQVGFKPGLATFFLDATDASNNQPVHHFDQPFTLSVHYTQQQLAALNIAESDLTIFWWDDGSETTSAPAPATNKTPAPAKKAATTPHWVPLPSQIDAANQTVAVQVDHFSGFALGDGSSPSADFLPSLQGWQDDLYTGSGSYSVPIEVPAGPGGLKPNLSLNYSSAATDGPGGLRPYNQASWVGKGWNLTTGEISVNKSPSDGTAHPTLALNGASYDMLLTSNTNGVKTYATTNDSYLKIEQVSNGNSYDNGNGTGRGGFVNGTPLARTKWEVWSKDGTLYEFAEDGWWGWYTYTLNADGSRNDYYGMETNRWFLSSVTDTHGNTISYNYGHDSTTWASKNNAQTGFVDSDIYPTVISWGTNPSQGATTPRFMVKFDIGNRSYDKNTDIALNPDGSASESGAPIQNHQLNDIEVRSNPSGTSSGSLIRRYHLEYYKPDTDAAQMTRSDNLVPVANGFSNVGSTQDGNIATDVEAKLTLKSIQRIGSDGELPNPGTSLPPTTFTYGQWDNNTTKRFANGSYNRLIDVDNGQGGKLTLNYDDYFRTLGSDNLLKSWGNFHRIASKVEDYGQTPSYSWTYTYTNPELNSLGTIINANPHDSLQSYPNSAVLYLAAFLSGPGTSKDVDSAGLQKALHAPFSESRGHAQVSVTDNAGNVTVHKFYQGDEAQCYPKIASGDALTGNNIYTDSCFQNMISFEQLRGREYETDVYDGYNHLYQKTTHAFSVQLKAYGEAGTTYEPRLGLWWVNTQESQTDSYTYDPNNGAATPLHTYTHYYYDAANQAGGNSYNNLTRQEDYDTSAQLYRRTQYFYNTKDSPTVGVAGSYMVDHKSQEVITDNAGHNLGLTLYLYDGASTPGTLGAKGELTRVSKAGDLNSATSLGGVLLHTTDSTTGYDNFGNPTTSTTYKDYGTAQLNASTGAWSLSGAGNGSEARTTTTTYDPTFHVYSVQADPPAVNGVTLTQKAGYDYVMGTMTSVTDPNNNTTTATYDVFGRLHTITKPGNVTNLPDVQADYIDPSPATGIPFFRYQLATVEPNGSGGYRQRVTEQFYDGLGRQIQTKAESQFRTQMVVTDKQYNFRGQVKQSSQPRYVTYPASSTAFAQYQPLDTNDNERWTTTTYDALARPLTVTPPDPNIPPTTTSYGLGAHGNLLTTTTDANGHRVSQENDAFGRLGWVNEYGGNNGSEGNYVLNATTTYSYSPLDQLVQVQDGAGNLTTLSYDSLGRKIGMTDPDMGWLNYTYDPSGNLIVQNDNKGQSLSFDYDALNRLTFKAATDPQPVLFSDGFDTKDTTNWVYNTQQTAPYNDGGNNVLKNSGTGVDYNGTFKRSTASLNAGKAVKGRFKVDSLASNTQAHLYVQTTNASGLQRFGLSLLNNSLVAEVAVNGTDTFPATLIASAQANTWYAFSITLNDTGSFTVSVNQIDNASVNGTYTATTLPTGLNWTFNGVTYANNLYLENYRELSTRPMITNATFTDPFDTGNTNNWSFSGRQTAPYNDNGNNVLKNVGTGVDYTAGFSRTQLLTTGKGIQFRFKSDSVAPGTNASFLVQNGSGSTQQRLALVGDSGKLSVQLIKNGVASYPATLIANWQPNTWYVGQLGINDAGGLWVQVYQQDNRAVRGSYSTGVLPTGLSWQFIQGLYANTVYFDDYQEYNLSTTGDYPSQYRYDNATVTNGLGQRTFMSNPNETVRWQYDNRGHVSQATYSGIPGLAAGTSRVFNWTYDQSDRLSTVNLPSFAHPESATDTNRETVTYTYDDGWRPVSLCSSLGGCYAANTQYNALGQPLTRNEGSSLVETFNYTTPLSRLSQIQVGVSGNTASLFNRSYSYDAVGNIKTITESGSDNLSGQTQNFNYDQRDRLVHAETGGTNPTASYKEDYTYDILGNLTSKAGVSYAYPAAGQSRPHTPLSVGGQNYSYDANGNLTFGGGRSYSWNEDNKPTGIVGPGGMSTAESYGYDAEGERVWRTHGSATTLYLDSGFWEETVGGEIRSLYALNGQVVAQRSSTGGVIYLHGDHLGSASLVTDGNGTRLSQQEFDPWGKVRNGSVTQTSVNYTGQRLDDGTGLLYYNARYYDPALGKFVSCDDTVPAPENPQAFNRYSYVFDNPLTNTDPSGHDPWRNEPAKEHYTPIQHITQLTDELASTPYYRGRTGIFSSYAANGCTYTAEAMIAFYLNPAQGKLDPRKNGTNTSVLASYESEPLKNMNGDRSKFFNSIAQVIDKGGLVELGFTSEGGKFHKDALNVTFDWGRHTVVAVGYVKDGYGNVIDIILSDPADQTGRKVYLSEYLNYHGPNGEKFGSFDIATAYYKTPKTSNSKKIPVPRHGPCPHCSRAVPQIEIPDNSFSI